MDIKELCERISEVIIDYRNREFGVYDSLHVERWISQFEDDEKELVLLETLRILKRNYITIDKFISFVNALIESPGVYYGEKEKYWNTVCLLKIQKDGNSQTELNKILSETLLNKFGVDSSTNNTSDEFIYLDDFIFSGNRLFSDMKDWIATKAPMKCRVCVITIGWFTYGQWSTENRLKKEAIEHGKDIKFVFLSYQEYRLENRLNRKDYSEVFWPTKILLDLDAYTDWLQRENVTPIYREVNGAKNNVFTATRREEFEKIIFKYGLRIIAFSQKNSAVVKPLGYSTFRGFGFGSTVFSFRNCPNNNPLVFWWGDPSASPSHPFSKWYPLLQRKTYG